MNPTLILWGVGIFVFFVSLIIFSNQKGAGKHPSVVLFFSGIITLAVELIVAGLII